MNAIRVRSSRRPSAGRRWLGVVLVATVLGTAAIAAAEVVTEIKVEAVRPKKEKHPTLRFLKENRDFIRARYDLLREELHDRNVEGVPIDPRFLAYQQMLRDVFAASDSVARAADLRGRQELLESIAQLSTLESRLDMMERLLGAQRSRLGVLEADFTGRQETALAVVVSGDPGAVDVTGVTITLDDGAAQVVTLTPAQRQSLKSGGVVQVFHRFVEPREQTLEVALTGEQGASGPSGFVTLAPVRDRLLMLRLDLTGVQPDKAASSIRAATWLHDPRLPSRDG